jgi:N-acetylneuraminate synthase
MNSKFKFANLNTDRKEVLKLFELGLSVVPRLDDAGRLYEIITRDYEFDTFKIDGHEVGGDATFIIAEIGNNHNGSLELAKKLVDIAMDAGADCVKFQLRHREELYRTRADGSVAEDLGVEYIQDLLRKVELTVEEHREIRDYCEKKQITYMCTPWDEKSVDVLASFNTSAMKIASADLCNPYLIRKIASVGCPVILSTGMAYENEIIRAINLLNQLEVPFAVLHCNSTYPAPEVDIQLGYITRLKELHSIVGYSGHERGTAITIAAVALGAKVVERHITIDRSMEGPDHLASLEPEEFKKMVQGIRQLEAALPWVGPGRNPSQGELLNREVLGKSVVAAKAIKSGEIFTEQLLRIASPGQGLVPYKLEALLGKKSNRDIAQGDFLFESDLEKQETIKKQFEFPIKWGVPIRYHDFRQYHAWIEPDLFEFHLSYRDLSVNPAQYLDKVRCTRLVIHAPELFENSELLDLAAQDEGYRSRSIDNLKRVIEATHRIGDFFPNADSKLIIANIGGFSADAPYPVSIRPNLYDRFYDSINKVDFGDTELIPQNMPPFPWHLGGQRHHNLFMMPNELAEQAKRKKIRFCLDLSHLQMTCSHFGYDFQDALRLLLPYSAHLHVADAKGANGEGVLMGTGDVVWSDTWKQICAYPNISFIPEIWQGHKDHGAGFWSALQFLKNLG